MSVDERIREGLLATSAALPEPDTIGALEKVTGSRATPRRRVVARAVGAAAAVVALVAGLVLVTTTGDDREPSPAPPAGPGLTLDPDAASVVETGALVSYGADADGAVLSVWTTCGSRARTQQGSECGTAWLRTGSAQPASGLLPADLGAPAVHPGGGGFVLQADNREAGLFVAADGTKPITSDCSLESWPIIDADRHVLAGGLLGPHLIDTQSGTSCDTTSFEEARTLSLGQVAAHGMVWGTSGDGQVGDTAPGAAALARYDGTEWTYRDLTGSRNPWVHALAVSGDLVATIQGADATDVEPSAIGLSVTRNGGATWTDIDAGSLPFRSYDSVAFAGPSALLVADGEGVAWRSTDLTTFTQVATPGPVHGLEPAGDGVIARVGSVDSDDLIRIDATGAVERLPVR